MLKRRTFLGTALGAAALSTMPKLAFGQDKPSFKLFDTHAHFYTNDADKYPFNAKGARYGPEKMVVKAMRHPMTPDVIFKFWDAAGIAKGCGVQYNSTYATDNSYLLDIAREYPDRIIPVVILDPVSAETPAKLADMAKNNRISGVRFTGVPRNGDYVFLSDAAVGAWEAANQLGLVIVLMPIGGNMADAMAKVGEHAARYPNVNIVLDHIGFPKPELTPDFGLTPQHIALADHKNVYYKYTTLLIEQMQAGKVPLDAFLEHMIKVFSADQMVWGSDIGNSEGDMLNWVHLALGSSKGLSLKQQKAIFHDTAQRIFVPGGRGA